MKPRLAAVLVTHNSAEAVGAFQARLDGPDEIVIVDNASHDHTLEAIRHSLPRALVLQNVINRGFAAAVNQGIRATSSELILLLNPDAAPIGRIDADSPMARRAAEPGVGVVGGKLTGVEGDVQTGFAVRAFPTPMTLAFEALALNRVWPSNPVNRRYRMAAFDYEKPQPCDQPAGAFMMFRRAVFDELGGFDESFYPVWFEDVDFCLRAARAGYANWYEPGCSAVHGGAHSVSSLPLPEKHKYWYGSLLRFAKKHFGPLSSAYLRATVAAGLALRGIASGWSDGARIQRHAYFQAMRMTLTGSIFSSPPDSESSSGKRTSVA